MSQIGLSPKERRQVELELALKRATRSEAKCEELKKALWACRARAEKLEDGLLDALSDHAPKSISTPGTRNDDVGVRKQLRTTEDKFKRSAEKISALRRQLEEERAENARLNRSTTETIAQLEADIIKLQRRAAKATADCETARRERTKLSKRLTESEADKRSIRIELDDARKTIHTLQRRDHLLAFQQGERAKQSSVAEYPKKSKIQTAGTDRSIGEIADDDTTTDAERPAGIRASPPFLDDKEDKDEFLTTLSSSKRVSFGKGRKQNHITETSAQRAHRAQQLRDAEQRYDEARRETEAEAKRFAVDREILKEEIQAAKAKLEACEAKNDELARRNAELDIAAAQTDREKTQLTQRNSDLEKRLLVLQADRDSLNDRCRSLTVARDLAVEEASAAQAYKRNYTNQTGAEDAALTALKAHCLALQDDALMAKKKLQEAKNQLRAQQEQTPTIIARESRPVHDEEARASLAILRADLTRITETVYSLSVNSPNRGIVSTPPIAKTENALDSQFDTSRYQGIENDENDDTSARFSRVDHLTKELDAIKTERDRLQVQLASDLKAKTEEIAMLSSDRDELHAKLEAKTQSYESLNTEFEALRKEEERARSFCHALLTKAQCAEVNEANALERIAKLESEKPEYILALTSQLAALKAQQESAVSDDTLRTECQKLKEEKSTLDNELSVVRAECVKLKEENSSLDDKLNTVRAECEQLKEEKSLLNNELNTVRAETHKLKEEQPSLNNDLTSVGSEHERLKEEKLSLENELDALRIDFNKLKEEKLSLKNELDMLRIDFDKLKEDNKSSNSDFNAMKAEYDLIKQKNLSLESQVEAIRTQDQIVARDKIALEENDALRAECEELKKKIVLLESEKLREMTATKKAANDRFMALEAERKRAEGSVYSAQEQCKKLEIELESAVDSNGVLRERLEAADARYQELEAEIYSKHDNIESERRCREEAEQRLSKVEAELIETKQNLQERPLESAETMTMREQRDKAIRESRTANMTATTALSTMQREYERLSEKLEQEMNALARMKKKHEQALQRQQELEEELEAIRKNETSLRAQTNENTTETEAKVRFLEDQLEAIRASEEKARAQCDACAKCAEINEANAQERIDKLVAERDQVRKELTEIATSKNNKSSILIRERDDAIEEREAALRETRQIALERDRTIAQRDELAQSLSQRQAELEHLQREAREANARSEGRFESTLKERDSSVLRAEAALARITASAESLETEKEQLEKEIEALKTRCHELERQEKIGASSEELRAMVAERDAAVYRAETAEADYKLLLKQTSSKSSYDDNSKVLQERLRDAEERATSLDDQLASLRRNLAEFEYRAETAEADYAGLSSKQEKTQSNAESESLRRALAEANKRADAAEEKLKQRSSRLSELREKVDGRRKETDSDAALVAAKQNKELRDATRQLEDLQCEHAAAKLQVAQLSAELDEYRHALKEATKQKAPSTPVNAPSSGGGFFGRRFT